MEQVLIIEVSGSVPKIGLASQAERFMLKF